MSKADASSGRTPEPRGASEWYEHPQLPADSLAAPMHFRTQTECCATCRFRRVHHTSASVSECLLLGRTLAITTAETEYLLDGWDRERVCDGWKRRPKTWAIRSDGVDANPHFSDPYLSREQMQKKRVALARRLGVSLIPNHRAKARPAVREHAHAQRTLSPKVLP